MTQEIDIGDDDNTPPWDDNPHVIGTTPGTVKLECPGCDKEGIVQKSTYHAVPRVTCPKCHNQINTP